MNILSFCGLLVLRRQVLQAAGAPATPALEDGGTFQEAEGHGDVGSCRPEGAEHKAAHPRPEGGLNDRRRLFVEFLTLAGVGFVREAKQPVLSGEKSIFCYFGRHLCEGFFYENMIVLCKTTDQAVPDPGGS